MRLIDLGSTCGQTVACMKASGDMAKHTERENSRGHLGRPKGDFKLGRMEGLGTFIGSDGDTYRDSWSSDRKHGRPDSSCYVGSWNKDLKIQQISK